MRIVLTGGGTAGHIYPLLTVARKIREKMGEKAKLVYIGAGSNFEEIMEANGITQKRIIAGKVRRYFSWLNFVDFFKLPIGFIQSLWILFWYMPDVVFSKGGYVSLPVVLAAWLYRIPVIIHESDAYPGLANRMLAGLAKRIALAYPSAKKYFSEDKTALIGNPVREELAGGSAEAARNFFNFTESKPVIFVTGGSQGSQTVNSALARILQVLLQRTQIIHQTGENNYESMVHLAGEFGIKAGREGYYPIKFLNEKELCNAYALADLVISRAGANSITDIAANGKPSILIPIDRSANDHQRMNAYELAKVGGALVLEEGNLGENILLEKIEKIMDDEPLRNKMSEKIKSFYHPQAAEHLANGVIELGS